MTNFIRAELLRVLDKAHPYTMPASRLQTAMRLAGFAISEQDLQSHLDALMELGYVVRETDEMDATIPRFKRTEKGRVWLSQYGLSAQI